MSSTAIDRIVPGAARKHRWRRQGAYAVLGAVILSLIGGVAAGAAVYTRQQRDLDAARGDRAAAQLTLNAAFSRAEQDGVAAADLAPVVAREREYLAELVVPARFRFFDNGEAGHVRRQAAELRSLLGDVDAVQAAATVTSRDAVADMLKRYDAAVASAQAQGLVVDADADLAAGMRDAVARADSPGRIALDIANLADRVDVLAAATAAKIAADAEAARQAAIAEARGHVQDALARADSLLGQARRFGQLVIAGFQATVDAQRATFAHEVDVANLGQLARILNGAADSVEQLLSDRSDAYAAMSSARQTVSDALGVKIDPGTVAQQLDALQAQLDAAGTSPQFNTLTQEIKDVSAPLSQKVFVAELGINRVIIISLSKQDLTGYQDGVVRFHTLVTTGRPALPTPTGDTTIYGKNHPFLMVSPWPPSSPYYYASGYVQYVLWFHVGGYGIHDANWRSVFGPGTQRYGSHGCVNVPVDFMPSLYAWAQVGDRVLVQD
jgi:lipoprotein-anchoring transpeptidase ErfK/SrfK